MEPSSTWGGRKITQKEENLLFSTALFFNPFHQAK
jgi:hypothetical protein